MHSYKLEHCIPGLYSIQAVLRGMDMAKCATHILDMWPLYVYYMCLTCAIQVYILHINCTYIFRHVGYIPVLYV